MKNSIRCILGALFFLTAFPCTGLSAVPQVISFQGQVMEDGSAITGFRSVTFSLWETDSGGDPAVALWQETQIVEITNGVYNVELGSDTALPLGISDYPALFLQIDIVHPTEGPQALTPLLPVTSTMFALKAAWADTAEDANTLDGYDSLDFSLEDHGHPFAEITGTATDAQIPNSITIEHANTANSANSADTSLYAKDADTVDGKHASAFAPDTHNHSGNDINSGTVSTNYYSAYSDLSAEGRLDNSTNSDLLTRSQADLRYVNEAGDTMAYLYVQGILATYEDLSVGFDDTEDDDYLYMDSTAEYLMWDEDPGRFVFSDDLYVNGVVKTPSNVVAYNNFGSGSTSNTDIANSGDVLIKNDLEVGGTIYAGGTRYLTIHPSSFKKQPTDTPTWTFNSTYAYSSSGTSSLDAYAPLYLPQGAVITQVRFYFRDTNPDYNVSVAGYLYERGLYDEVSEPMIGDSSTITSGGSPSVQTLTAGTIHLDTIDNQNNVYVAHVYWNPGIAGTSLRFYGCRITYTTTQLTP